jgi:hypothetical protein
VTELTANSSSSSSASSGIPLPLSEPPASAPAPAPPPPTALPLPPPAAGVAGVPASTGVPAATDAAVAGASTATGAGAGAGSVAGALAGSAYNNQRQHIEIIKMLREGMCGGSEKPHARIGDAHTISEEKLQFREMVRGVAAAVNSSRWRVRVAHSAHGACMLASITYFKKRGVHASRRGSSSVAPSRFPLGGFSVAACSGACLPLPPGREPQSWSALPL